MSESTTARIFTVKETGETHEVEWAWVFDVEDRADHADPRYPGRLGVAQQVADALRRAQKAPEQEGRPA